MIFNIVYCKETVGLNRILFFDSIYSAKSFQQSSPYIKEQLVRFVLIVHAYNLYFRMNIVYEVAFCIYFHSSIINLFL